MLVPDECFQDPKRTLRRECVLDNACLVSTYLLKKDILQRIMHNYCGAQLRSFFRVLNSKFAGSLVQAAHGFMQSILPGVETFCNTCITLYTARLVAQQHMLGCTSFSFWSSLERISFFPLSTFARFLANVNEGGVREGYIGIVFCDPITVKDDKGEIQCDAKWQGW